MKTAELITTGRYHTGERKVAALVRRGRTKLHVTYIDDAGIVHRALPLSEERFVERLPFKSGEYPVGRMVKFFRSFGRARGITEAAKEELSRASTQSLVLP